MLLVPGNARCRPARFQLPGHSGNSGLELLLPPPLSVDWYLAVNMLCMGLPVPAARLHEALLRPGTGPRFDTGSRAYVPQPWIRMAPGASQRLSSQAEASVQSGFELPVGHLWDSHPRHGPNRSKHAGQSRKPTKTGAVCKTVGSAYVGSNPTPATRCRNPPLAANSRAGGGFLLCPVVCHLVAL